MKLGPRIRDYEIWGRLGEGGMSDVWLGRHSVLSLPVVFKTLRGDLDEEAATSVLDEARMMARIHDPRVVRAIDAGVHEGTPYLVEEYVDGIDLDELDRRRRSALGVGLPLWFVCHVMRQTCRALHAAHQKGIIHRDVKPSNVFGAPETGIRLGDFGIAMVGSDPQSLRGIRGTMSFMAPEQLRGQKADRTTDVFGAAVTAYVLRYGMPPFATIDGILDPTCPVAFPQPKNPPEVYFQQVLAQMLEKTAEERPHCASTCARHFRMIGRSIRPPQHHAPLTTLDRHTFRVLGCQVTLVVGDIAEAAADAIVSSSNFEMKMRAGVADALRRRGGDEIEAEAMRGGEQPLGSCVATTGGKLAARHVLHAVSAWNEASCVGRATQRAFLLADELGVHTLAIPALGTGAARVSLEACANAMMTALRWHVALGGSRLESVRVFLDSDEKRRQFRAVAEEALRDEEEAPTQLDLGLPVTDDDVRGDSATHIDLAGPMARFVGVAD